jgi:phosphoribosylformimino-5-aminoimidazole carboxamide ribotide isomerase
MHQLSAGDLRSRVLPVIDLLAGHAMRAVRGRRSEYQPIESVLLRGSDPVDLAKALVERFGFQEIYVADLDALQGGQPQFGFLRRIADLPVRFLFDLGMGLPEHVMRARQELPGANFAFVVATEASPGVEAFRDCLAALEKPTQAALGLDYLRGEFRTKSRQSSAPCATGAAGPEAWIVAALQAGAETVLALDLDRVGSDCGFAWPARLASSSDFRRFRRKISGGGIRSPEDVIDACAKGCDAVLVGSALHDGRISSVLVSDCG